MGRGKCLYEEEKSKIVQQLKQGKSIKQISPIVKRDPRTMTRLLDNPLKMTVCRIRVKWKLYQPVNCQESLVNWRKRQQHQVPSFLEMMAFKITKYHEASCKACKIRYPLKDNHEENVWHGRKISEIGFSTRVAHRLMPCNTGWTRRMEQDMGPQWSSPSSSPTGWWRPEDLGRYYWKWISRPLSCKRWRIINCCWLNSDYKKDILHNSVALYVENEIQNDIENVYLYIFLNCFLLF